METGKLLNADYLDIIYENRNKSYGGYELRRHYDQRLRRAALFALTGVAAVLSFSFIAVNRNGTHIAQPNRDSVVLTDIKPPVTPPPPIPKIIPPPPPQNVKVKPYTNPVVVTDDFVSPDKQMTQKKDLANAQIGNLGHDGDSTGFTPADDQKTGTSVTIIEKPAEPVRWVEQMPQFVGDINDYLGKHLQYPESALSAGIEGRVNIEFVVNEDGSVSNARVTRGIGGGCDEEALRIINGMPRWKPGKQNGTPVKVYFILPIVFQLK